MAKVFSVKRKGTKIVTPGVKLSYVHLNEAHAVTEGQDKKYSVSIIIPKSDKETLKAIKEAIDEAKEAAKAKFGGKIPSGLKVPVRDGDEDRPEDDVYANSYFINASSKSKPQVVDLEGKKVDEDEIYSGMIARVSINFYGFAVSGNKGVAAGLGNVQKVDDGERLGGGASAAEDFDIEKDDEDFDF